MQIAIYILIKIFAYIALCRLALPIFKIQVDDPMGFAMKWGFARLGIGLVAGIPILWAAVFFMNILGEATGYVFSFILIRYLEWYLLVWLMSRKHKFRVEITAFKWVSFGVLISSGLDGMVVGFNMLDGAKFFC